jgi:hypothetical protein
MLRPPSLTTQMLPLAMPVCSMTMLLMVSVSLRVALSFAFFVPSGSRLRAPVAAQVV